MAQVWLVTGSSRGLGRAIVEAGLAAGNKVLATARGIESLADLSERYGDQVKLFALDVTDEAAAANAVMAAIDLFGSLDVVINNAGYGNLSSIEDTPLSEFRAQIETNLFGTIIVTKAALTYFREKQAGHFIQFSSVGRRIGPPGRGPYSAAKWGVEGFSEVLSREVAPLGIMVTIVEPGGLLLLSGYFVPLALTLLGAEIYNILAFHLTLAPASIPPALVASVLWILVFLQYRASFKEVLAAKPAPKN
jgi:NAD(P)-dependent dehydrogenase (short-subunit alcohol dehydrogenase family)